MLKVFTFASLFIFLWGHLTYAQQKKLTPFSVTITVNNDDVASAQAKAQLEMARNKSFCRGFMIPRPKDKWICNDFDGERVQCIRNYICRYASRFTNRKSESIREYRLVKKLPRIIGPFQMNVLGREIKFDPKTQEKVAEKAPPKAETDLIEVEEISEQELDDQTIKADEELAKLESEEKFFDEAKNENNEEDFIVQEDKTQESSSSSSRTLESEWLNFGFQVNNYSDTIESMMTFNFAYEPRYYLWRGLYAGGNLSFHTLTTGADTVAEESFWVRDLGIVLGYQMERGFYFGYAFGSQSWGNEAGDSFNYTGFIGGYRFTKKLLKYIDRFHVQMNAVDTLADSKELKIGVGATF